MVSLGFRGYDECGRKVKELLPDKEARILDFGCGTGIFGTMVCSLSLFTVRFHNYLLVYAIFLHDWQVLKIKVMLENQEYHEL